MKNYFRLLRYAGNLKEFLVPFVLTSAIAAVFGVLNLILLKPLLDVLFGQVSSGVLDEMLQSPAGLNPIAYFNYYFAKYYVNEGKIGALSFVCAVLVLGIIIGNIFRYLSLRLLEVFKINMVTNLRRSVFEKTLHLDLSFFNNERKGNLISRITTDVQEVENSIANTFSAAIKELLLLVGYLVALFSMSVKLTFFALIVVPITGGFLGFIVKKLRSDAGAGQQRLSSLMTVMDEAFSGMQVVKAYVAESFFLNRFQNENQGYKKSIFAYAARREMANPVSEVLGVCMVAALLFYGGSLILSDESNLDASTFMAYIALFSQVVRPAKSISQAFSASQRGIAAGERVLDLLDKEPDVDEPKEPILFQGLKSKVSFEGVGFAYETGAKVLDQITFDLYKGKTIALVGPSGGGKSTIADLFCRFFDPQEGQIYIDGVPLKSLDLKSFRSHIGLVSQDAFMINDTIRANIAFGRNVENEEVEKAAKMANAYNFIMEQAEGFGTYIGDRGVKLSGGQKQRLSIARALIGNPGILLLDEATSALDTASEKQVQEAIARLMKGRTSLVIAHRLSTIQNANEIMVIDQGKIVQRGTHESLMKTSNGLYAKLVQMQEF